MPTQGSWRPLVRISVASPSLVIVATVGVAEAQVTWLVRFWVELSEYVQDLFSSSYAQFLLSFETADLVDAIG